MGHVCVCVCVREREKEREREREREQWINMDIYRGLCGHKHKHIQELDVKVFVAHVTVRVIHNINQVFSYPTLSGVCNPITCTWT